MARAVIPPRRRRGAGGEGGFCLQRFGFVGILLGRDAPVNDGDEKHAAEETADGGPAAAAPSQVLLEGGSRLGQKFHQGDIEHHPGGKA